MLSRIGSEETGFDGEETGLGGEASRCGKDTRVDGRHVEGVRMWCGRGVELVGVGGFEVVEWGVGGELVESKLAVSVLKHSLSPDRA